MFTTINQTAPCAIYSSYSPLIKPRFFCMSYINIVSGCLFTAVAALLCCKWIWTIETFPIVKILFPLICLVSASCVSMASCMVASATPDASPLSASCVSSCLKGSWIDFYPIQCSSHLCLLNNLSWLLVNKKYLSLSLEFCLFVQYFPTLCIQSWI